MCIFFTPIFSPETQKAAEAAWNIGMFALPYAGITRIRY
jgi:hypothetical protein